LHNKNTEKKRAREKNQELVSLGQEKTTNIFEPIYSTRDQ
tara:strand:+ start:388 stop:507 length:120 start_codon:yes stop_codon:yes gene_type:complete